MPVKTSFMQDLGNSIVGSIPKAILCVRKLGDPQKAGSQANALQNTLLDSASRALKGNNAAAGRLSNLVGKDGSSPFKAQGYLPLEVQYNPSSIVMRTEAGKQVSYSGGDMGSEANNQIVQVNQPVVTTMSFQLIFDDVNVYDAFMMQNMNDTAGNMASLISDAVKSAKKGGYAYSVKDQIDGLLSLLVADETRKVIFYWSDMVFGGELTEVDAKYTMFNKHGSPIRGVVQLTIRQGDGDESDYDGSYWDIAFDRLFGDAGMNMASGGASKLSMGTQNNLLNLNI